jgi:tetratricopeptide (TPR) repeat protein
MRLPALIFTLTIALASAAQAEIRTLTATGEYRMGDNDTKTDAKRLALQDGKRLALEKAGTYIESITEVKNFQLSRDELRAYTAGMVEVLEQQTRSTMEGETTVVRVDVTCKIDTAVVARQIEALRKNETAKADLLHAQHEADRLRQENETLRQQLASAKSKPEIEAIAEKRRAVLTELDVESLLAQAWVALVGSKQGPLVLGSSSAAGRTRARGLIEQALALDPSNPDAHRHMGGLLHEEGNVEGAIAEYRTTLRLTPDDADAHNGLGNALQAQGDLAGAIAEYRTALRLQPDAADAHNDLGLALQAQGDLAGAIAEYRTALRLKPDYAAIHNNLGNALQAQGDLAGAIAEYRTALRLKPPFTAAHNNLGIVLQAQGDLDGAIAEYRTALRLKPDNANAHTNLGTALQAQGDLDGAIAKYRTALRLTPNHANAHYGLGLALKTQGQRREAARAFRDYLRLAPDTPANRPWIEKARQLLRELE